MPRTGTISTAPHATWAKDDILRVLLAPWVKRDIRDDHPRRVLALQPGTTRDAGTFLVMLDTGQRFELHPWEVVCNLGPYYGENHP